MENFSEKIERATFAGGCFWCMVAPFQKQTGIISVVSGYSGGDEVNPAYEDVAYGKTGHFEAVQISYDPGKVDYQKILEIYWKQIDPTDEGGQFADRGKHYQTVIFYHDEKQKKIAEASKESLGKSGLYEKPIVTEILPFKSFYAAEDYHQDYHEKNPFRYSLYRQGSGRDRYLQKIWGNEYSH